MPRQPQRPLQYAPRRQPFPVGPADEGEFDFSRPFLVDIGRAAVIAEYLRDSALSLAPLLHAPRS